MTAFSQPHFDRYRPGSVEIIYLHTSDCPDAWACLESKNHAPLDVCVPLPVASLPHQHDNWCIGELIDVDVLIVDLQAVAAKLRGGS